MAGFSGPTLGAVKTWTSQEIDKAVVGSATPLGPWDASTNTPPLPSTAKEASFYDVVVAGTHDGETYQIGDTVKFSSSKGWYKVATHVDVDSVKQHRDEAKRQADISESYANASNDSANQSANSATQSGTYATQSGNYAGEAMQYRDDVLGKFWQGDMEKYKKDAKAGIIKTDTIAFIMQEGI